MGEVLLEVLAEIAGDAWTPDVEQAWTHAYATIKSVMLDGAQEAESAA